MQSDIAHTPAPAQATSQPAAGSIAFSWSRAARPAVAFAITLVGALAAEGFLPDQGGEVAAIGSWFLVAMVAGAVAGRARQVWVVVPAAIALFPASVALGLDAMLGPWWFLQAAFAAVVMAAGFGLGATLGPGRRPWSVARGSWHGARRRDRVALAATVVAALALLGGYVGYAGLVGSDMFIHPEQDANCTTPAQAYGWTYEAINYDPADDARLAAANSNPLSCTTQGAEAGSAVVSPDGVRLAGWYIPAAAGVGPTAPTIVLVHGWHSNKSGMLPYAEPLHAQFNLVIPDLRDNGRSSPSDVTMGTREQTDLEAMIDWLVATKHPTWIGAVGNSMGGATVLAAASQDERIRAVLLESTHANLVVSGGNIAENEHDKPAQPTGWALISATSLRLGLDVTAIDPERTIGLLGERPVLLIHGTADRTDYPATSAEWNLRAALDAGVPAQLVYCAGGIHGQSVQRCPDLWRRSATDFFAAAAGL